jgi:hypothetical protein
MKAAQDNAPREAVTGKWANPPIQVDDDLAAIIKAIGGDPSTLGKARPDALTNLPTTEY